MAATGTGRLVSQAELANTFGTTTATVRSWENRGCPIVDRGGKGKATRFNTADVFRWREEQIALAATGNTAAMDIEDARRRRMIAVATLAEVEAALRKGEVVLIEDVVRGVVAEYTLVRNKLLNIGSRIAPRVAVMKTPEQAKALIDAEVALVLQELSADTAWQEKAA